MRIKYDDHLLHNLTGLIKLTYPYTLKELNVEPNVKLMVPSLLCVLDVKLNSSVQLLTETWLLTVSD